MLKKGRHYRQFHSLQAGKLHRYRRRGKSSGVWCRRHARGMLALRMSGINARPMFAVTNRFHGGASPTLRILRAGIRRRSANAAVCVFIHRFAGDCSVVSPPTRTRNAGIANVGHIAIHRKFQTRRVVEDSTRLYGETTQHRMRLSVDGYKCPTYVCCHQPLSRWGKPHPTDIAGGNSPQVGESGGRVGLALP